MPNKLERTIYGNRWVSFLLLLPFVEPGFFSQYNSINTVYLYVKLIAIFTVVLLWMTHIKLDNTIVCVFVLMIEDCIVTTLNGGNTSQMYINAITNITLVILFGTAARYKSINFLYGIRSLFELLIIANFITILLFPEGLYNFDSVNAHYLLGHRNVMMRTIFPGVCIEVLISVIEDNKIKSLQVIGGCAGNLAGISSLVVGMDIDHVIERFSNVTCGPKPTSCPDQIATALKSYKELHA